MLKYKYPKCPSCDKNLFFRHSFLLWNPWSFKCPLCSSVLETTKTWKIIYICSVPGGLSLAAIAIYQEEKGNWVTADSSLFFFLAFLVLMLLSYATWPLINLKVKNE